MVRFILQHEVNIQFYEVYHIYYELNTMRSIYNTFARFGNYKIN